MLRARSWSLVYLLWIMVADCAFGAGSGLSDSPSDRDALGELCSSIACRAKSNSYARGPAKRHRPQDSATLLEAIFVYKQPELKRGIFKTNMRFEQIRANTIGWSVWS